MANEIISKIMYQALLSYRRVYADDMFFSMLHATPDIFPGGTWRKIYNDKRRVYLEKLSKTKDGSVLSSFTLPSHFLTDLDFDKMRALIVKDHPELVAPWEITSSTKAIAEALDLSHVEAILVDISKANRLADYDEAEILTKIIATKKDNASFYARIIGTYSEREIEAALKGFLFQTGFLTEYNGLHRINEEMSDVLEREDLTIENMEEMLFPHNLTTELTLENFPHLATEIERCEKIVNANMREERGTNIMFWGIPGCGKTEIIIALAKKNGWKLKMIGDISANNMQEKSRTQRLTSLKIATKLYAKDPNVVLAFDEMEDLFKDRNAENFSKAFINRIIETTQTPIFWTTNDLQCMGPAVLRRMVYNIGFEVPPVSARELIWKMYDKKYDLKLSNKTLTELADDFDIVPALIHNAAKITHLTGLEVSEIPEIISSLDTLMNGGMKRQFIRTTNNMDDVYDAAASNTDLDLDVLTEALINAKPGFSLCLYGPPGTGKTEYVKYLANKLKKKVSFKKASDLLDPYVGGTEAKIAEAFERAAKEGKILQIDEGDSFLKSRERAVHSWESTQTNEMLTQMENHCEPFVITTNLMEELDRAAMRRFTFKVRFDYMKPHAAEKLFEAMFKVAPPKALLRNEILTPGDFRVVKKKADILNITDANVLYSMVLSECKLKDDYRSGIGFGAEIAPKQMMHN